MIDMHSHILPGLDDGASDWDQAIAMARVASSDGILDMVCTPHWIPGKFENTKIKILSRAAEFEARLTTENIPLKIHCGAELRIDPTLLQRLKAGELPTLNNGSGYVLLELPDNNIPTDMNRFFWELQINGFRPILSHVERNPILRENTSRLFDWVGMGILTQITAVSLLSNSAKVIREFAFFLVEHRLAHMLVTDTHSLRMRRPELSGARNVVENIMGAESAERMVCETPGHVLRGEQVDIDDPIPIHRPKKNGVFWFLFADKSQN
jgi:protein-tyrosine phosphatase